MVFVSILDEPKLNKSAWLWSEACTMDCFASGVCLGLHAVADREEALAGLLGQTEGKSHLLMGDVKWVYKGAAKP